ncbi:MAG: Mur ligase domain-containing protein, partial [Candidatus Saccharimonadales bacterium]
MHIYFSGIGGAGIGPLAEIAMQAGYTVSGSDKQHSAYVDHLKKAGITAIAIDQSYEQIAKVNAAHPIDWLVYSSALPIEQPNSEEIRFAEDNNIRHSKRDELINAITKDKKLSLIGVAGTHGKTTTTAQIVWLCYQHQIPISYLLPAKTSFGPMGRYLEDSRYFVFEADEFDRNFLHFEPWLSVITGVSWDHHEIFPTREIYQQAFIEFISQSKRTLIWQDDALYLGLNTVSGIDIQEPDNQKLSSIKLKGLYNRLDGWLALQTLLRISDATLPQLIQSLNLFPGLSRRMEQILPNLYSDYAHTPDKIRGAMSVASEMADPGQNIIVIYEPLTDRRQ